jgi:sialate O-acetylesterase
MYIKKFGIFIFLCLSTIMHLIAIEIDFAGAPATKIFPGLLREELPGDGQVAAWNNVKDQKSFILESWQGDWVGTDALEIEVYAEKATGQPITVVLYSENNETEGEDYYKQAFTLNWSGWKTVYLSIPSMQKIRQPAGVEGITKIRIASDWIKEEIQDNNLKFRHIRSYKGLALSSYISNNMVIQANKRFSICGQIDPASSVKLLITGNDEKREIKATSDSKGQFEIKIPPHHYGDNYRLELIARENLIFENVSFGDVWFCSGQSNMEMKVKDTLNADNEIASSLNPRIRLLTVQKALTSEPVSQFSGSWELCSPKTIPAFSALAYYFGREIQEKKKITIGLIHSSWGGTEIKAWTPYESLKNKPAFAPFIEEADSLYPSFESIVEENNIWWKLKNSGVAKDQLPPEPIRASCVTSVLYNSMVHPLTKFPLKGVLWYQGESDTKRASMYGDLLQNMVKSWRKAFADENLPFYVVQLANYGDAVDHPSETNWAELRFQQAQVLQLKNTDMATAIDIGEAKDIHPKNKQEVGRRLALIALKNVYSQEIVSKGPQIKSAQGIGSKIKLIFDQSTDNLVLSEGESFCVAGKDGKYYWAMPHIESGSLMLTCDKVKEPRYCRYAWAINPKTILRNLEGLPAFPFQIEISK